MIASKYHLLRVGSILISAQFMSMNAKTSRKMPAQDSSSGREKKKGGGFLMRAAKSKKGDDVTEEQLLNKDVITPQDIVKLDKITKSKLWHFSNGLHSWPKVLVFSNLFVSVVATLMAFFLDYVIFCCQPGSIGW